MIGVNTINVVMFLVDELKLPELNQLNKLNQPIQPMPGLFLTGDIDLTIVAPFIGSLTGFILDSEF